MYYSDTHLYVCLSNDLFPSDYQKKIELIYSPPVLYVLPISPQQHKFRSFSLYNSPHSLLLDLAQYPAPVK